MCEQYTVFNGIVHAVKYCAYYLNNSSLTYLYPNLCIYPDGNIYMRVELQLVGS